MAPCVLTFNVRLHLASLTTRWLQGEAASLVARKRMGRSGWALASDLTSLAI